MRAARLAVGTGCRVIRTMDSAISLPIAVPLSRPMIADLVRDPAVLRAAAEDMGLRLVVLFGSRVGGEHIHSESDVDVGIVAGSQTVAVLDAYSALAPAFAGRLDVAILNDTDPLFRFEVFSHGMLLYGDPDLFAEYQAYAYRDYMDSADLRALEDALSRKKLDRLLHAAT
jgi:predicted nucleotidyltransferase